MPTFLAIKPFKPSTANHTMNCFSLALFTLAIVGVRSDDALAQAKCRSLHHVDVDSSGTQYSNQKCLLLCSIHGKVWPHNMSEGLPCPALLGSKNVCQNGQCVAPLKLGYIDIEMTSASLAKKATALADVCIQNATTAVSLPIANRTTCISCDTKAVSPTTTPLWNAVCTGSHKFLYVDGARVTFEVWDGLAKNSFAGGATLTIGQLLANGDSHKQISLPLANGNNSGKITVRVTWTPK